MLYNVFLSSGGERVYLVMLEESDLESEQDLERLYGESCLQSLPLLLLDFQRISCSVRASERSHFDLIVIFISLLY